MTPSPRRPPTRISALGGAVAAALILTSCVSGGAAAPEADIDPADFEGLELTMWSGVPYEPFMTLNQEQLSACAEEIGATVTAEAYPSAEFGTLVLQAGASDGLPDLLMVPSSDLPQYAEGGILTDLSSYGLAPEDLAASTEEMGMYDGTLYGLASHVEVGALQYDTSLVDAPPATFDELRAQAAELTTDDRYGIALPGSSDGAASFFLLGFILSAGGDPGDFESPGTIAAIQLYKDLVADGSMSPEMVSWGWDFQDQYNSGAAAMTVNGPWAAMPEEGEPVPGFAPYPTSDGAESRQAITASEWTIPATDPVRQAAAAEILECRLAADNQLEVAQVQYYIPARLEVGAEWEADVPSVEAFTASVEGAYNQGGELGEDWYTTSTQLANAIQYAVVGDLSAAEALQRAASE
ncbi:multiple sugar transport system substrate-binding protein [Promicromonospora sp. AC04]|uniref:sugar ABC transporter substrate-binding protein n=1 Tax=Promicromonospora sp. AC04 TaxID=2135723 RepID=UPI000D39E0E2|nr:extracellular solute-binding protein [Promicromonospora sp. AC04]PUB21532.1 multiple sugar transport system substrate-binding protein [Promicromonospora sp. AC04]